MPRLPEAAPAHAPFRAYRAVFFALPFWGGLFFTRQWCGALLIHGAFLLWQVRAGKRLLLPHRGGALCAVVLPLCALAGAGGWADAGAAAEGLLWLGGCLLFALLLCQWDAPHRRQLLDQLPLMGFCMTVLCAVCAPVPALRDLVWENGRMAGPFGYANAFGVFLLAGLVQLAQRPGRWRPLLALVLLGGICLSRSRGSALVLALWALWFAAVHRPGRRAVLAGGATVLLLGSGLIQRFGGDFATLWGRLLYMKDGLRLLARLPLGTGRLGWFYLQGPIQTGVYNVRFVHNDWLQFALDYGIPAGLVLALWLAASLRRGCAAPEVALVLLVHCFADVDIPFTFLAFVLLLALSARQDRPRRSLDGRAALPALALMLPALLWAGADSAHLLGQTGLAVRLTPWNTEPAVEQMLARPTLALAEQDALAITARNPYQVQAWQIRAESALDRRDYEEMSLALRQVLALKKYDQSAYNDALAKYQTALEDGWTPAAAEMARVLDRLDTAMDTADPLAWRLPDKPALEIDARTRLTIRMLAQRSGG